MFQKSALVHVSCFSCVLKVKKGIYDRWAELSAQNAQISIFFSKSEEKKVHQFKFDARDVFFT